MARRNKVILAELNLDVEQIRDEEMLRDAKIKKQQNHKTLIPRFRENDNWRFYWDTSILLIAIWNSISIPVAVFFNPPWEISLWYLWLDYVSTILFFTDIAIMFNTTYYNADGEEIRQIWPIAKNYLSKMFFIDFISTVPWDALPGGGSNLRLFSILKVVRIQRLNKMVNKLSYDEETKAVSSPLSLNNNLEYQNCQTDLQSFPNHAHYRIYLVLHRGSGASLDTST
jgi:hypothetical protein